MNQIYGYMIDCDTRIKIDTPKIQYEFERYQNDLNSNR